MPDKQTSVIEPCDGHHTRSPALAIPYLYRQFALDRDGRRCRLCGDNDALIVDYIFPRENGGTNAITNFQVLCISCADQLIDKLNWWGINNSFFAQMCDLREGAQPILSKLERERYEKKTLINIHPHIINDTINDTGTPIINGTINKTINADAGPPSDNLTPSFTDTASLSGASSRDDNNIPACEESDSASAGNAADDDLLDIPSFLRRNPDGSFVDGK